jgi:hypothetical protein
MLGHVQNGVDDLKITQPNIAALSRQAVGNAKELVLSDFHLLILPKPTSEVN